MESQIDNKILVSVFKDYVCLLMVLVFFLFSLLTFMIVLLKKTQLNMKAIISIITIGMMICCNLLMAQTKSQHLSLDTSLHLTSARRFPFTGKIDIAQNYPNPFSIQSSTTIRFKAIDVFSAQLIVYSANGEIFLQTKLKPGVGQVVLDGGELSPGIYLYALLVNGRRMATKRMLVLDNTHAVRP
jgi:hypothetical protein